MMQVLTKCILCITTSDNRLSISILFEPYKESKKEFKELLEIVNNWAIIYDKSYDLTTISRDEIKNVQDILYELDNKYLQEEGLYAEDAYEWIIQFQILIENYIKERNDKNAI